MNNKLSLLIVLCIGLVMSNCSTTPVTTSLSVTVNNTQDFKRNEIVSIPIEKLSGLLTHHQVSAIRVEEIGTKKILPLQWIDTDQDDEVDELLFLVDVNSNTAKKFRILADSTQALPKSKQQSYARFVPERTDDYAWENDKVAFRTYGPTGEQEALQGVPGSTLSSGIDIWLKRTEKPIINEWYKGYEKDPWYYHTDRGDGYDPYHVGKSRGVGGVGIYEDDSLLVSHNFKNYKTIAKGPLRSVFELIYEPWSRYGVCETKRITIDAGSHFSKVEMKLTATELVPNYTIGLTMHDYKGKEFVNAKQGWVRYWEKIDDAYVGEGLVFDPEIVITAFAKVSDVLDESQILVLTKPEKPLVYYAGFAWQKSGAVANVEDWDLILRMQQQIHQHPLEVTIE